MITKVIKYAKNLQTKRKTVVSNENVFICTSSRVDSENKPQSIEAPDF